MNENKELVLIERLGKSSYLLGIVMGALYQVVQNPELPLHIKREINNIIEEINPKIETLFYS